LSISISPEAQNGRTYLWLRQSLKRSVAGNKIYVAGRVPGPPRLASEQKAVRKAYIKWLGIFDLVDFLLRQFDAKGFNIALEMLHFAATNDGKDVLHAVSGLQPIEGDK
jgi:hypothetical protein